MAIRLTVLGKSPSWQDRDGACSGYLVEAGATRLLIDCGSGVFAKLRRLDAYERVDAVVLSHIHADHMLDLVPFSMALTYGPNLRRNGAPALHVPPGGGAALSAMCGAWGTPTLIDDAFELREYDPSAELVVGDASVRFALVPHYVPSYAIDLRVSGAGKRLVFSADCAWNEELVELAHEADLLLIESTLLADPATPDPGHLSAAQAGELARRAGARRAVLTHFSDQLDPQELRARAEQAFGGPVELAAEGASFTI
ncbi:MAG: MBL fold metallo-hydrolase [Solirubrobacteraceae bacterium]